MGHVCVHYRCIVFYNTYLTACKMAGRNDCAIADALVLVAQELHGQQNQACDKFRGSRKFQRNNPLISREGMFRRVLRCGSKTSRRSSE